MSGLMSPHCWPKVARLNSGTPIRLHGVSKHYGDRVILNNFNLHIASGQDDAQERIRRGSALCAAEVKKVEDEMPCPLL